MHSRAERDSVGHRGFDVVDTPVRQRAIGRIGVGQQPELVTAHLEAHVERFVEVGLEAEQVGPPLLGGGEVVDGMDDGTESL